jgi:glycosyltransferase involved in cell wall biosynthesis
MMRLAIVEQESQMGGVEYSTLSLATALDRTQFTPIVITPDRGPLAQRCRAAGIPVLVAPRPRFRSASVRLAGRTWADPLAMLENPARLSLAAGRLTQVLRACSPDLVLTKGLLAHFYGGMAARRAGLPCIWHVQDEVPARRAGGLYLRALQSTAGLLADAVIGDAASIAGQFPCHPRVHTVYNGIDTAAYAPDTAPGSLRADLGIPADAMLIGNLARLTDWKGQHVLIEAFNQIAPAYPGARLVLIGSPLFDDDSYELRLRRMAAAGPAAGRIHFAGYRVDTAASLAALDIYVHPSVRKDTAPLALLSALATGLPTIISAVPGMIEVVEPGVSALVVPAGDSAVLARTLATMLEHPGLQRLLAEAGRVTALRRFSVESYAGAMAAIFAEIRDKVSLKDKFHFVGD